MRSVRTMPVFLLPLAVLVGCTSATDRFNDGIALQSQGRYVEAVYRYADAIERDAELAGARDRLLSAGDSAVVQGMDRADQMERSGDPVGAAAEYRAIDGMLARVREVGMRIQPPGDYSAIRRATFDTAINWQMERGHEASEAGRWEVARDFYVGARGDYLPSRDQVEQSYDAETNLLMTWADIALEDEQPRFAWDLAGEALAVRSSPSRETVLGVRDLQDVAIRQGTVVLAVAPVMADPAVRDWLGGEFEVQLDSDLGRDYWVSPPPFIEFADPLVLRGELRGLLRGQGTQSPLMVGRALGLIGADLGVMIQLTRVDVVETDVDRNEYDAVVPRNSRQGARRTTVMDTVPYTTLEGTLEYYVEAEILLVDTTGREVNRFSASTEQDGPFERGEFDGDPNTLPLERNQEHFFDPAVIARQMADIESAVLQDLAGVIATGTFDQVLAGIR